MSVFVYDSRNERGERVNGTIEASSRFDALRLLQQQGNAVLAINPADPPRSGAGNEHRHGFHHARVSLADCALFFRQLAIAIGAGMPIRDCLQSIAEDMDRTAFREVLRDMAHRIDEGLALSDAARRHPRVFDRSLVALLAAAEESGSMTTTLDRLATMIEKRDRLNRKIRGITAYPVFVAAFFLVVCIIITVFVLPRFQQVFAGFDATLPRLTRVVFASNQFIMEHLGILGVAAGLIPLGLWLAGRTPAGAFLFDRWRLRLPFFGACVVKGIIAKACRTLAMMLRGGVPIATAMELTAMAVGNLVIERALLQSRDAIINGTAISDSLGATGVFPKLVRRMIHVGETSGRLPDVLDAIGDTYEDQIESSVLMAMALFEPLVIVLFGAVILVLVLAIYLPVFTVSQGVK